MNGRNQFAAISLDQFDRQPRLNCIDSDTFLVTELCSASPHSIIAIFLSEKFTWAETIGKYRISSSTAIVIKRNNNKSMKSRIVRFKIEDSSVHRIPTVSNYILH